MPDKDFVGCWSHPDSNFVSIFEFVFRPSYVMVDVSSFSNGVSAACNDIGCVEDQWRMQDLCVEWKQGLLDDEALWGIRTKIERLVVITFVA